MKTAGIKKMKVTSVNLPIRRIRAIKKLVELGEFPSFSECVRSLLRDGLVRYFKHVQNQECLIKDSTPPADPNVIKIDGREIRILERLD